MNGEARPCRAWRQGGYGEEEDEVPDELKGVAPEKRKLIGKELSNVLTLERPKRRENLQKTSKN